MVSSVDRLTKRGRQIRRELPQLADAPRLPVSGAEAYAPEAPRCCATMAGSFGSDVSGGDALHHVNEPGAWAAQATRRPAQSAAYRANCSGVASAMAASIASGSVGLPAKHPQHGSLSGVVFASDIATWWQLRPT
jgi:hypothetical protein